MKIRKTLCYLLSVMLLACIPWSAAFAAEDLNVPVKVESGEHMEYGKITTTTSEDNNYAALVEADSPEDASLKATSISLTNDGVSDDAIALGADSYPSSGLASADITEDVTVSSKYDGGYLTGVDSYRGDIKVGGKVTATATGEDMRAYAVNVVGGNITVGKDVTATGSYAEAIGVYNESDDSDSKTTVTVNGSVTAQGEDVGGLCVYSGQSDITIKKGITATATGKGDYDKAIGMALLASGESTFIDVSGDVTAKAANGNANGIAMHGGESSDTRAQNVVKIHGNVISDSTGISTVLWEGTSPTDILVENTIKGKNIGVLFRYPGNPQDIDSVPFNMDLTTWKIDVNKNGNVAEISFFADLEEGNSVPAKDFEKQIKYIVKVKQPSQGGTLSAVDVNGKALPKSFNFPIAHEGEKIILKADLKSGWKIKAAYNGVNREQKLSKDENGNYYLIVPKGGGIYLSADLEKSKKQTKPAKAKVSGVLLAKMLTSGKTGVTVTWTKVKGVKGYDVFFCRCDGKEDNSALKKVATVKAGKKLKWSKKGLKQHRAYKAIVKAYVYKKGKKKYVRTSPLVHAYSSGSTKRYTNASDVTVDKTELTLNKKGSIQIKGKAIKNNEKKIMNTGHSPYLRYLSSNKKIATVSKSGRITAKAKGTCDVYTLAHNGIFKKIKVTVK